MMPGRIGLFVHNGRLTVVGMAGRDVEHFVVEDAEDPAATLAAELQARRLTGRHVRVGLDRWEMETTLVEFVAERRLRKT